MSNPPLADPDTLLGQLQRGRGSGYIQALQGHAGDVAPLLFHCVTRDPREDRQLEERADYYAGLLLHHRADLRPYAEHLRRHDDSDPNETGTWLLIETQGALARHGSSPAVVLLRDYLTWGSHWQSALYYLQELRDVSATAGLDRVLCDRFPDDEELRDGLWSVEPEQEPWRTWMASNSRLCRLIEQDQTERAARPDPRVIAPELLQCPLETLFDQVTLRRRIEFVRAVRQRALPADLPFLLSWLRVDAPEQAALALAALAELADARAVEALREFAERGGYAARVQRFLTRTLEVLPADHTLPFAREWFGCVETHLEGMGEAILEAHAQQEDLPRLRAALLPALEIQDHYRMYRALRGMLRLELPQVMPEVEQVYAGAAHSWTRTPAAEVLHRAAPEAFGTRYAVEGLWDCESRTIHFASEHVDLGAPAARQRLGELADPPWEQSIRDAAARRLSGGS